MKKAKNTVSSAADLSHSGIIQSEKPERQSQPRLETVKPLSWEPEGTDRDTPSTPPGEIPNSRNSPIQMISTELQCPPSLVH